VILDPQAWQDSLAAEAACAERLLALTNDQQSLLIHRKFVELTSNLADQHQAVEQLFALTRRRTESQQQLARVCMIRPPGRRLEIYPHLPAIKADEIERIVLHLQTLMDSCQRAFRQNQLLLGKSIELAQQVLQRSGVVSTGRTYGARGKERAFATANPVSRWQAVV
jgi:flagellar biosynthesis/type III secretory pathway chaperone